MKCALAFRHCFFTFILEFDFSLPSVQPSDLGHDATIPLCHDTYIYPSPSGSVNLLDPSRTFRWKHRNHSRTLELDFPYMNLIIQTFPGLLVISRNPFETPNNIRYLNSHSISTKQHRILKCVSLWFVNYADMTKTLLRSITNRGI